MIMANAFETTWIAQSWVSVQGSGQTFDDRNPEKITEVKPAVSLIFRK